MTTSKTLSKQAEAQIIDAVTRVCSATNDGEKLTDAAVKVATGMGLSPNFINLMCLGYNAGTVTHQRETGNGILEKLAEVPLLDPAVVTAKVYPPTDIETENDADVSADYSAPVGEEASQDRKKAAHASLAARVYGREKAAEETIPQTSTISTRFSTICSKFNKVQFSAKQAEAKYREKQATLLYAIGDLCDRVAKQYDWSMPELEKCASVRYGDVGKAVMNCVQHRVKKTHRDAPKTAEARRVDWNQPLFEALARCVKVANEVVESHEALKVLVSREVYQVAKEASQFISPRKTVLLDTEAEVPAEKFGLLISSVLGSGVYGVGRSVGNSLQKPTGEIVDDYANDLNDVATRDEIRDIRAQTMLTDFLTSDDVIGGFEPEQVFKAYTELANLVPAMADDPSVVRVPLRRLLTHGSLEPFEVNELVNIDKSRRQAAGLVGGSGVSGVGRSSAFKESSNVLRRRSCLVG